MYTSVFAVALVLAPVVAAPDQPTWQSGYSAALDVGQKQRKPVAVFVGSGPKGQAAVVQEGQFSANLLKVLAQDYVCVYLDRSQAGSDRLIRDLGIGKAGIVVSDRTGNYQAFHHDGVLSQETLARQLERFADRNYVVSSTVSNNNTRVSYYPSAPTTSAPAARANIRNC